MVKLICKITILLLLTSCTLQKEIQTEKITDIEINNKSVVTVYTTKRDIIFYPPYEGLQELIDTMPYNYLEE